jgi:hypothetical protein
MFGAEIEITIFHSIDKLLMNEATIDNEKVKPEAKGNSSKK